MTILLSIFSSTLVLAANYPDPGSLPPNSQVSIHKMMESQCIVALEIVGADAQGPNYATLKDLAAAAGIQVSGTPNDKNLIKRFKKNTGEVFSLQRDLRLQREDWVSQGKSFCGKP